MFELLATIVKGIGQALAVLFACLLLLIIVVSFGGLLVVKTASLVGWNSGGGASYSPPLSPRVAPNGDRRGHDNDSDGHREHTYVRPHMRGDVKVRGHYRK